MTEVTQAMIDAGQTEYARQGGLYHITVTDIYAAMRRLEPQSINDQPRALAEALAVTCEAKARELKGSPQATLWAINDSKLRSVIGGMIDVCVREA